MKILLATDGSDCSKTAVKSAAERPWPEGSEVKIISARARIARLQRMAAFPPRLGFSRGRYSCALLR